MRSGTKTKKLLPETALGLCVAKGVTETTLGDRAGAAGLAPGEIPPPGSPSPVCLAAGAGAQGRRRDWWLWWAPAAAGGRSMGFLDSDSAIMRVGRAHPTWMNL